MNIKTLPMRYRTAVLAVIFALLPLHSAYAYIGLCCGKCGGNMPMNIAGGGIPETHEFRFKLQPMFMKMDGLRDGTDSVSPESLLGMPVMMGMPTGRYMAAPIEMNMDMLNLAAGYSFTDKIFGGIMLMWKRNDMDMAFNQMMTGITQQDGFTMESEGLADTMLMGKYRLFADDPLIPTSQVSLLFALSLPTGSINQKNDQHPLAMRRTEQLPYSMQLGSGTLDPTIGVLYQESRSPWWWGANLSYTARLYENDRDYRLGDQLNLDLYGMYQLSYNVVAQLQLNTSYQGKIRGEMDEAASGLSGRVTPGDPASPYMTPLWDPDNYGGAKAIVTAGLQWQPASLFIIEFNVGIPVYQDLNGPQLEEDYRLMLTFYKEIPTRSSIRYSGQPGTADSELGF